MKCFSIILLLFTTLLCSCSDNSNIVVSDISLDGQEIRIDSSNAYMWPHCIVGNVLYAYNNDYYAGKISKSEWQKSEGVLMTGQGHNEFGRMVISKGLNSDLFVLNRPWVGDKLLSLTIIPSADSIAAVKDETNWYKYDLKKLPAFWDFGKNFVVLSDSSLLVLGAPAEERSHVFSIIDFKNFKITPLDYWPDDGSPSDDETKNRRYTDYATLFGDGKGKYLYTNGWGALAFIFTIDGSIIKTESILYNTTFTKDGPTELLSCCANANNIYVLFRDSNDKGDKIDKYNENDPYFFGNTLVIYDWNGVKQHIVHLDKSGQDILLSEDGQTLYLLPLYSTNVQDPIIYSYNLSKIK